LKGDFEIKCDEKSIISLENTHEISYIHKKTQMYTNTLEYAQEKDTGSKVAFDASFVYFESLCRRI